MSDTLVYWWERTAAWAVAALFAVSSAFLGMCRKHDVKAIKAIKDSNVTLQTRIEENKTVLNDHETRLQITSLQCETMKDDLSEIKTSIGDVHARISEHSREFNSKLDRLLER